MNTKMYGGTTAAGNTQNGPRRRGSLWKRPAWITALILLIPVLGNHFVDGWDWDLGGFVVAGIFLFVTSLTYELVTRKAAQSRTEPPSALRLRRRCSSSG